jgi:[ribosomal protein S5]-alanine N-acetyltransferase
MANLLPDVVPRGTMAARPQPVLEAGASLRLRPWAASDVPAVVAAYADPDIQRWHLESMDETEAAHWITRWTARWQNETDAGWAITDAARGTVLGRIGLRRIHLDEGRAEVAYWVLAPARGRAVASRAVEAIVSWAFDEIGLHRLDLMHSVHNQASCRVATKTGFAVEGVLRDFLRHHDGWHDMHLHGRVSG